MSRPATHGDQVEPRLLEKISCPCGVEGCTAFGVPTKNGHPKGCSSRCPKCRGRRNRAKGRRKQAAAVRGLGIPRSNLSPGHEEFLQGPVRVEVKAGGKAKTVDTAYRLSRAQSDAAKAVGDTRGFVAAFMPDGCSYGLYVIRSDELEVAVYALADAFGYGEAS